MLAAIIGGRLQGLELAWLARQAGWQTLLVDRRTGVPAQFLCDRFLQVDLNRSSALDDALKGVDIVIPALENPETLHELVQWGRKRNIPIAFDPDAYAVSSSKIISNRLFASLGIPVPAPWPQCGFPIVAKPSDASGSDGVTVLTSARQAEKIFPHGIPGDGWVIQEYLDGPSFSLEVVGRPGHYMPLLVTELFMDAKYDCRSVAAPCGLSDGQIREMETQALAIAEAIQLTGLMDVEWIFHEGRFKVLEIDARFPSQTPLAVYHAIDCNMVEMLADIFLAKKPPKKPRIAAARSAILEHIRVVHGEITLAGEHIMADAGPLHRVHGFFGADEAITNYRKEATSWVATLIITGRDRRHARSKRDQVLSTIRHH